MTDVSADAIAETFGFEAPIGPLEPMRQRGQVHAWRLETGGGRRLVKRFWADDELPWQDQLEQAMEIEQRAVGAGIDTPAPIAPVRPLFGSVARIDGHGLFRAFPYVEHRPLANDDDIAEWVGATLARIHRLHRLTTRPAPNWWYCQFPPVSQERWRTWLREGETAGAAWAPALRTHLELVLEQARQVVETFNATPPYVLSHRDVEPWNVLITDDGPTLIDWDTTGPESAPLEAAYAFISFARHGRAKPDPDLVRRSHQAYVAAGGAPLRASSGALDRLIGFRLSRLAGQLGGFFDVRADDDKIRARIEELPTVVANARAWERLLDSSTTRA